MRNWLFIFMAVCIGMAIGVKILSQPSPIALQSTPQPSFADGVQFGVIALQRNPDVQNIRVLQEIAFGLWTREMNFRMQKLPSTNSFSTNTAATNADDKPK